MDRRIELQIDTGSGESVYQPVESFDGSPGEAGVASLFQAWWGITVSQTLQRLEAHRGGEEMEIDLLLVDGETIVVVDVKSTLRVKDVRDLLNDLKRFMEFFPQYLRSSPARGGCCSVYRRGSGSLCLPSRTICSNPGSRRARYLA